MLHLLVYEGEIGKDENSEGKSKTRSINFENGRNCIDPVSNFGIIKSERR